jgi:hypothetical protein
MPYIFRLTGSSRCAVVCALAFSLGGGYLLAQSAPATPPQEAPKEPAAQEPAAKEPASDKGQTSISPDVGQSPQKNTRPTFRRWGIGGIFTYNPNPFNLMKGGTVVTTAETLYSKSEARPLGGGVAAYFYLTSTLSLNLDFIYRRTGYDASRVLNDAYTTSYYSRTRANYFDFPLLARYHSRYSLLHSSVFVEGGGTARFVEQITTSTTVDTTVNAALVSDCCTEIPDRPSHRLVAGPTVGLGLRIPRDEIGVQIVPEIRYTRWLENTFSAVPTMSNRNQAEVLLSITF